MPMINRREAIVMGAGAFLAINSPVRAQAGKVVKYAPHTALRVLDPVTTNAYITRNHGYMVYDTLFSVDSNYRPQPQMVKEWKATPDNLTYTFVLRDGLAFHDDTAVTAEDCIASIDRWSKRDVIGVRFAKVVEAMRGIDAKTFEIKLKEPFGAIFEGFSRPSSIPLFIMPKRIADTPPDKPLTEVIGSGPFKFIADQFRPGVSWAYERNAKYVPRSEPPDGLAGGKVVKVDRVEAHWMPSRQTQMNALLKGEIDLIETLGADDRKTLEGKADIVMQQAFSPSASTIRFNWSQPPFNNVKMRQAVQAVVTQQDYMDATVGDPNAYQVCGALFGCGTPLETDVGFPDTGKPNPDKAKALIKEAGYNGERITIINPGDVPSFNGLAPLTQQVLKSIGVSSEIQSMEWSAFLSRRTRTVPVSEGGWHLAHAVFNRIDLISPLGNLNFDARGNAGYTGFVDDADTETLKTAYQHATDSAKQLEVVKAMQKRAYDLVFYIPLGTYRNIEAFRSNIKGLVPSPVWCMWGIEKV